MTTRGRGIGAPAMTKTSCLALLTALVLLGSLPSCGGGTGESPYTGAYQLDLEKTLAANGPGLLLGGSGKPAGEPLLQALAAQFSPDAWRLELLPDGAFLLLVRKGETPTTLSGRWADLGTELRLWTRLVDGQPTGGEEDATETVALEPPHLVLVQGESRLYLKRL